MDAEAARRARANARRQWLAHSPLPEPLPRAEWPGERFDIQEEHGRAR